jgi:uncharacterized OB-fold protein
MTTDDVRPAKPVPVVAAWARPFWDAAREGRLILQHCEDCDRVIHYPRMACPFCSSKNLDWKNASGRGTIYSFTVVESNAPSAFAGDVPYVVAVIRLDEGVQMLTNIVESDRDELVCDLPVEVVFEQLNDEFTLPKFRPVR